MPRIRGTSFLNSARYVRERYGPGAHEQVLRSLPAACAATFLGPLREASWAPLEHLIGYMEAAQALLAPGDSLFYRNLGRDAGRMTAQTGVRHLIGSDPLGSARRAAFLWSSFYDTGRAEIVERRPEEIVFRIHDFPTPSRAWCERIVGWMQGCFDTMGLPDADISETECRLLGGRYCEVRMQWAAPDPSAR